MEIWQNFSFLNNVFTACDYPDQEKPALAQSAKNPPHSFSMGCSPAEQSCQHYSMVSGSLNEECDTIYIEHKALSQMRSGIPMYQKL
jgi:hypothetical protein